MTVMTRNMREFAGKLFHRRAAYRAVFLDSDGNQTVYGRQVLDDLAKFCRFASTTAMVSPIQKTVDPIAMAMAEGRREVYLRIVGAMHLDQRKLIAMTMEPEPNEE